MKNKKDRKGKLPTDEQSQTLENPTNSQYRYVSIDSRLKGRTNATQSDG